ncbi:MAG: lactoylglutathione lyase [Roseivirga sp.]|jgi:lactoylglutathione lyase
MRNSKANQTKMKMFRLYIFLLLFALNATTIQAQNVKFNHMALVVSDLEKSIDFYSQALGFKLIDDPTGNPNIAWVQNDTGQQIHLLEADLSVIKLSKSVHMSFAVETLSPFIENLTRLAIYFEDWPGKKDEITIRQDGIRQIYLQDPNGYWIEINDDFFH